MSSLFSRVRLKRLLRRVNYFVMPVIDITKLLKAPAGYYRFFSDWTKYKGLAGAQGCRLVDARPELSDWTDSSPFDSHYIYLNAWAFRKISAKRPQIHVDIGSQVSFVTTLSAVVPVIFIDCRPLQARPEGLYSCHGDIHHLPFGSQQVHSVSTLHVIEHIGLGRYGDTLDPLGTRKALAELSRIMAMGGDLYIGLPVGRPRVCFNAYRVVEPLEPIRQLKERGFVLNAFAAVDDEGKFYDIAKPESFKNAEYACGMYHFINYRK